MRAVDGNDTQFRFVSAPGLGAFSWIDQGLGFAIVGALDRDQLLALADSVYLQLDPGSPAAAGTNCRPCQFPPGLRAEHVLRSRKAPVADVVGVARGRVGTASPTSA